MSITADESHVPLSLSEIRDDIYYHMRAGWNFVGATPAREQHDVVLRYRRSRGVSAISSDAVATAVIDHLRRDERLALR